jgi:hypothetical protein
MAALRILFVTAAALLAAGCSSGDSTGSSGGSSVVPATQVQGAAAAGQAQTSSTVAPGSSSPSAAGAHAFAAAIGGGGGATPTASPPPTGSGVAVGAYVNTNVASPTREADVEELEASIGRKLAIVLHFQGWKSAFPNSDETADADFGRVPLVSWNCGDTNANVAAGKDDATIDAFAAGIKSYTKPVMLRWFWEMNLSDKDASRAACHDAAYDPADGFDAAHFVAAWQHVHDRFVADGVTNVVWLWCPSTGPWAAANAYYPGAAYVDWVGIDTYDRKNLGVTATIDAVYPELVTYAKPIAIAENGEHSATAGGNQPTYFASLDKALRARSQISAYLYFDANVSSGDAWALDRPLGIASFGAFAKGPYESVPFQLQP